MYDKFFFDLRVFSAFHTHIPFRKRKFYQNLETELVFRKRGRAVILNPDRCIMRGVSWDDYSMLFKFSKRKNIHCKEFIFVHINSACVKPPTANLFHQNGQT